MADPQAVAGSTCALQFDVVDYEYTGKCCQEHGRKLGEFAESGSGDGQTHLQFEEGNG